MANVKNFGLIGVGSELQFGKASSKIINNAGNFNLRAADGTTPVALSSAGITSSAGNVTLTTGNVVLSSTAGTIGIGGDVTLQRQAAGVLQLAGTGAFMAPVGNDAARPTGATGMIRVNNQSTPVVEFYNGTVWTQVGDSGAITALQTEVDNIETSLGSAIDSNGEFVSGQFTDSAASATSFTQAINLVAAAAAAKDTLDEILPGTDGQVIYNDAGTWAVALPGSTSNVQAWDAGLDALAAYNTNGFVVQTADDTFVGRSLVAPAAGITITNADAVSGNPTFALANDLAGLEGLTDPGYAVRTGDGTWTNRSISGASGRIVVTNGDGVASNTDVDLATVSNSGTGTFLKVTVDTYGRVTGTTAVVTSDITTLVDSTYVNVAGDTMTGNLNMGGSFTVTGLATPVNGTDAANKNYVDSLTSGLSWKQAVAAATTANVDLSTDLENGDTLDGYTLVTGDRVLVKNQSASAENGIYIVQATGAAVRSADMDQAAEFSSATVFVQNGTANADTGWTQTATVTTVGTDPVTFVQFTGAGTYTAGTGLSLSGNTFNVNLGAGIVELPTDEVGLDIVSNLALQLTAQTAGGQLTFVLDGGAASGLEQSSAGLKISAGGVTNAMLVNDGFTINGDSGTPNEVSLGDTFLIAGTSVQGISTAVTADTITITAADASSSQKGVASFTTSEFTVTSGNVALGLVPVTKGGTGLTTAAVGDLLVGNGANSYGALAIGTTGQYLRSNGTTAAWAALSASDITGTLGVANGGTGATSFTAGRLLIGDGTNPITTDAELSFNAGTDTLTVGTATIQGASGGDVTITATATDADINLVPNGTGQVIIGPSGAGVISADSGQTLTIIGNDTLVLESTSGDIVMTVPSGTGTKVTVSGPTAANYATSLADEDLVNKYYVDQAIQSGAASGSVKVVKATVSLAATGSTNIGSALPAGASILRVKVQVNTADTGTGTLQVGKAGGSEYMTTSENDTQTTGLYLAETYVVEAGSVQVQATVAGTPAGSGSAVVIVEYQVA